MLADLHIVRVSAGDGGHVEMADIQVNTRDFALNILKCIVERKNNILQFGAWWK